MGKEGIGTRGTWFPSSNELPSRDADAAVGVVEAVSHDNRRLTDTRPADRHIVGCGLRILMFVWPAERKEDPKTSMVDI